MAALQSLGNWFRAPAALPSQTNDVDVQPLSRTLATRDTAAALATTALLLCALAVLGLAGYLAIVSTVSATAGLSGPVSTTTVTGLAVLGTIVPAWVLETHRVSRAATMARLAAQLGLPLHRYDDASDANERFLNFASLCLGSVGDGTVENTLRGLKSKHRERLALLMTGAADKAASRAGLGRIERARLAAAGGSLPWASPEEATKFLRGLDNHLRIPEAQQAFQNGANAMDRFDAGDEEGCRTVLKTFLDDQADTSAGPKASAPVPTVLLSRVLSPVHRETSAEKIVALHKVLVRDTAGKKSARPPQQRGALVRVAFPDGRSAARAAMAAMRAVDRHNMRYPELAMRVGMALVPRDSLDPSSGINPLIRRAGVARIVVTDEQSDDLNAARLRLEPLADEHSDAEPIKQLIWW